MSEYFKTIGDGVTTVLGGMKITWEHMINAANRKGYAGIADENYFNQIDGLATLQYPSEVIPTPSFARYRLHNEADDCIACDQCARACPVNCITIDSFKVTPDDLEEAGSTADGTKKKLWLPVFDIDMAKCMYCGLCTYPCPTECITMTPVHDFSEFDRSNFIYYFGNMTPEAEAEKREKLAKFEAEKAAEKARAAAAPKPAVAASAAAVSAPAAGAKMSPMMAAKLAAQKKAEGGDTAATAAPVQPVTPTANQAEATAEAAKDAGTAKPLPKLSPMMAKLAAAKAAGGGSAAAAPVAKVVEPMPSEPAPFESAPQPEAERIQPEDQDDNNSEPPAASMPASDVSADVDIVAKPADEVKPAADDNAAKAMATVPVTSKPKPVTLEIRKVDPKQTEVKIPAVRVPEIRLPEIKVENILSGVTALATGALYIGAGLAMALTLGLFKAITAPSEPRRTGTDPIK